MARKNDYSRRRSSGDRVPQPSAPGLVDTSRTCGPNGRLVAGRVDPRLLSPAISPGACDAVGSGRGSTGCRVELLVLLAIADLVPLAAHRRDRNSSRAVVVGDYRYHKVAY